MLGPLGLQQAGQRPSGVRRIEVLASEPAAALVGTSGAPDPVSLIEALRTVVAMHRRLRAAGPAPLRVASDAEAVSMAYLDGIDPRFGRRA